MEIGVGMRVGVMWVIHYTVYNLLLRCGTGHPGVGLTDWWGWG